MLKIKSKFSIFRNKVILESILLLLFFVIIFLMDNLVFVNSLNDYEYEKIYGLYQEMRMVNPNIKNDMYCNKGLKYLDRSYILEELVSDSLKYSLYVSEMAFSQIKSGESYTKVIEYLNRCNLNFEDYNGLDESANIFSLNKEYFNNFTDDSEKLEYYSEDLNSILKETDELFERVSNNRWRVLMVYSLSYLFCFMIILNQNKIINFVLYGIKRSS